MRENGRSMIEMLGVLAIVGVLSVGAMSGYAKAMLKYKLNKQTEQIGSILDYASLYSKMTENIFMTSSATKFSSHSQAVAANIIKV